MSNSIYQSFHQHLAKVSDLSYAGAILSWDQQTYMPKNGAKIRAQQMATLRTLSHEMFVDPKIGQYLEKLSQESSLSENERANIQLVDRDYKRSLKYPKKWVEEFSQLTSGAFSVWHEAKEKNDFKPFGEVLSRIIDFKREEVEFLGYEKHPYDALVDEYEPGLTVKKLDEVFGLVAQKLFPFIKEVIAKPSPRDDFIYRSYSKERQWDFAKGIIEKMGYDFSSGRADHAPHPFCTSFGPGDVRVTIRGDEKFFNSLFFAAVHEAGHALYELGLPVSEHYGLPLGSALSMPFHESQSRFWENNICRSHAFWKGHFGQLQKLFPESLNDVSVDEFVRGINKVEPILIRVEADELTYHGHIYIRYQIEKALLSGELQVKDVPAYWNEQYKNILGIVPPNDAEGCLQDVHWSYGAFGYFPTYSLGSFYAAQIHGAMQKEIAGFNDLVEKGDFQPLLKWLREKIHRHGRKYESAELLKMSTGEELNIDHFLDYVRKKYG